jgi:hypothetical protein
LVRTPARTWQQGGQLVLADKARVELVGPRVFQPAFPSRHGVVVAAEIDDAGGAEAGLGAHTLVHPLPQAQAFDDEGKLARVTAHLAHPAPVAAGLLAGDMPLLAQHDGNAALGQEIGG